ncbi:MAG: hypothetical protein COA99_08815 [Moraxellaceae bacterium]|nr:MAG: hypothetical protein COA99_08815 [Moraxellaceae bacterium]
MESGSKSWMFWLAVLLCVLVPALGVTKPLAFESVSIAKITELLVIFFVVTLFMERAQEVILTTWRARGGEQLDLTIRKHKRAIQRQKKLAPEQVIDETLYDQLELVRIERMDYRAYTRVIALRLGLLFGLVISIAGVRSLGMLVDVKTLASLGGLQLALFHMVDVLLTGSVIAGGSDGIHKMTELYRSYMDVNVQRNKRKKHQIDVIEG